MAFVLFLLLRALNPNLVPGYEADLPKEVAFNEANTLEAANTQIPAAEHLRKFARGSVVILR